MDFVTVSGKLRSLPMANFVTENFAAVELCFAPTSSTNRSDHPVFATNVVIPKVLEVLRVAFGIADEFLFH